MGSQADAIAAAAELEVATACKAFVLELGKNLRASTPVRTGHARASWIASVADPSDAEADGADDSAYEAGVQAVLAYQLDMGDLYVSNSVPYIQLLNLGYSDQQPVGWVEAAIDLTQTTMNARYAGRIVIDATGDISAQGARNLAAAYDPMEAP